MNPDDFKMVKVDLSADVTKPVDKLVSTLCKYLDIPQRVILRLGKTSDGILGIFDEKLEQKKLDIRFLSKIRRYGVLQQFNERRERNINKILHEAIAFSTQDNSTISDKEVSEEWLNFFFENAQNISTEELQLIWAKILSGEVSKPGSFSIRTFDTLRCLDQETAENFVQMAQYACWSNEGAFLMIDDGPINDLRKLYGLTHSKRLSLEEAGLIHDDESTIAIIGDSGKQHIVAYTYGKYVIEIRSQGTDSSSFKAYSSMLTLTKAGSELSQFVEHSNDINIFPMMFRLMRSEGIKVFYRESGNKAWLPAI